MNKFFSNLEKRMSKERDALRKITQGKVQAEAQKVLDNLPDETLALLEEIASPVETLIEKGDDQSAEDAFVIEEFVKEQEVPDQKV